MFTISNICLVGSSNFVCQNDLKLSTLAIVWTTFGAVLLNVFMFAIDACQLLIFGETVAMLCGLCKCLENSLDDLRLDKDGPGKGL